MATMVLFNGIFNTLVLGLPMWVYVILVIGILTCFTNAYWWFMFWSPLKPLHGLWKAIWTGMDAVLLSDENMTLKLTSEARAKLIFNESIEEARKNEKDWRDITSGQIGVVGTDIILDFEKWNVPDTNTRYAIEEAADAWNMEHPEDQIHSFAKFQDYCEQKKIYVDIPTMTYVDWIRIESSFPKKRNTAAYAGYIRQLAEKLDKEERSKMNDMALYLIGGSVIVSALFILGKFLMHKP